MKPVILIGAGGHGTVLLDALRCLDAEIIGVCDPSLPVGEKAPLGTIVLGGDDAVLDYPADEVLLVNGIGSIGRTKARRGVYEKLRGGVRVCISRSPILCYSYGCSYFRWCADYGRSSCSDWRAYSRKFNYQHKCKC